MAQIKLNLSKSGPPTTSVAVISIITGLVLFIAAFSIHYLNGIDYHPALKPAESFVTLINVIAVIAICLGIYQTIALILYRRHGRELEKKRQFNRPKKKRK